METWLSPYLAAYTTAYGENPTMLAIKRMGKIFKALEQEYPRAEVARRFLRYCQETPARFYSAEHFGSAFAAWGQRTPEKRQVQAPTTKRVAVQDGERMRLVEVPIDDPRPAA